jgi:hypothetical protein
MLGSQAAHGTGGGVNGGAEATRGAGKELKLCVALVETPGSFMAR